MSGGYSVNSGATTYRQSVCEVDETLKKVAKRLEEIKNHTNRPGFDGRHNGKNHLGEPLSTRLRDAEFVDNSNKSDPTGTRRYSGAINLSNDTTEYPQVPRRKGANQHGNNTVPINTNCSTASRNKGKMAENQPPQTTRSSGGPTNDMWSSQRISTIKPMTSGEQNRMEQSWKSLKIK